MIKQKINVVMQTTILNWLFHTMHKNMQASYQVAQAWVIKTANAYFDQQMILADEIIRENTRLYPYNFLGSPQSLFVLPGNHHLQNAQNSLAHTHNREEIPAVSVARVNQLDKYRYELIINGNTEDLRVNIYDEARELVFSEQLTRKGSFSQIYDLKWAKVASVFLEVVNKNGVLLSRQF